MTDLRLKRRLVDGEENDETRQEMIVLLPCEQTICAAENRCLFKAYVQVFDRSRHGFRL